MSAGIQGSVGKGGLNAFNDVLAVQKLLNQHRGRLPKIAEDGVVGPETIGAIAEFQARVVRMANPDGRVDVGGPTFKALAGGGGPHPAAAHHAAPPAAGRLAWPLHGAIRITTPFGVRDGAHRDHDHGGIDLAAGAGTTVFAAQSGRVLYSGAASGYGHWVVFTDGHLTTIYGHVSGHGLPAPGSTVTVGDAIAEVGAHEGRSTGPHLHFEVHQGGFSGPKVNPVPLLPHR